MNDLFPASDREIEDEVRIMVFGWNLYKKYRFAGGNADKVQEFVNEVGSFVFGEEKKNRDDPLLEFKKRIVWAINDSLEETWKTGNTKYHIADKSEVLVEQQIFNFALKYLKKYYNVPDIYDGTDEAENLFKSMMHDANAVYKQKPCEMSAKLFLAITDLIDSRTNYPGHGNWGKW